jgi:hypothetical protein
MKTEGGQGRSSACILNVSNKKLEQFVNSLMRGRGGGGARAYCSRERFVEVYGRCRCKVTQGFQVKLRQRRIDVQSSLSHLVKETHSTGDTRGSRCGGSRRRCIIRRAASCVHAGQSSGKVQRRKMRKTADNGLPFVFPNESDSHECAHSRRPLQQRVD